MGILLFLCLVARVGATCVVHGNVRMRVVDWWSCMRGVLRVCGGVRAYQLSNLQTFVWRVVHCVVPHHCAHCCRTHNHRHNNNPKCAEIEKEIRQLMCKYTIQGVVFTLHVQMPTRCHVETKTYPGFTIGAAGFSFLLSSLSAIIGWGVAGLFRSSAIFFVRACYKQQKKMCAIEKLTENKRNDERTKGKIETCTTHQTKRIIIHAPVSTCSVFLQLFACFLFPSLVPYLCAPRMCLRMPAFRSFPLLNLQSQ